MDHGKFKEVLKLRRLRMVYSFLSRLLGVTMEPSWDH